VNRLPVLGATLVALGAAFAAPAAAQEEPPVVDTVQVRRAQLPAEPPISPGGAFLRSLALPAWGHAEIGSGRGVFYTAAEAGSAWMIMRVQSRLNSARDQLALRESAVRAAAIASGVTDEAAIESAVDDDEGVQDRRTLVEAREGQREDWIALAIFSVLLSGVDAYVSTHLNDFPDPISSSFRPSPWGGVEFGARIGWPLRR
jgi:hypothetical protein